MERARDAIVIRPPSRPDTRPLAKAFRVVATKADQLVQSAFDVRCSMLGVGRSAFAFRARHLTSSQLSVERWMLDVCA
jgi:hypothetical protein